MAHGGKQPSSRADALRWWRGERPSLMAQGSPRKDAWVREREGSPADIAETAFGMVAPLGMYTPEAEGAGISKVAKALRGAKEVAPKPQAFKGDPLDFIRSKLRTEYPEVLPGVLTTDPKSGKEYLAKVLSPEAEAVQGARKAAQKDIEKGNYAPYFDVTQRAHVDPTNYPTQGNTLTDAMPKKQATVDKFKAQFDTPEIRARLTQGYLRGAKDPLTKDWYAMQQLEKEYVKELGPAEGQKAFRELWESMAATTGGADPTSNLIMAHYGNLLKARGQRAPEAAHEMPFPIGGRYASGNMAMYNKVLGEGGKPLSAAEQPKRFNFASNFMGHRDRSTIDEQMMGGFDPTGVLKAPPGASYGVTEGVVGELAKKHKVMPQNFQDVAWAGLAEKKGKPMISHVNEALERTSRITGLSPEAVLRLNLIRRQGPIYGAGAGIGLDQQGESR